MSAQCLHDTAGGKPAVRLGRQDLVPLEVVGSAVMWRRTHEPGISLRVR